MPRPTTRRDGDPTTVLVVGASGPTAGLVAAELRRRGARVRGMIRDPGRACVARRGGSDETVVADLADPASLRAAADGVDAVFHLGPVWATGEAGMGVAMVEAAKAAGARKVVFSSVYHPSLSLANHVAKRPVEEALFDSGLTFTVLQPAMFMQNLGAPFDEAARSGEVSMPYSRHARVCYVDYRDVAEAAAVALTTDRLDDGTFELSAPGTVDRRDIARLMGAALGRTVRAGESPPPDPPSGDDEAQRGMARMFAHYDAHGFPGGNALVLRAVLGHEPRSLADFFAERATATA